ncbi:tetratricopeptide repeat protein, partial [Streptomyces europaeiscabiei]
MVRPDELDRARQSCAEGESLLAAGNRTEAARAFRAALTCTGPGSRGDEVPARGTGPDGTSPEQGTAAAVLAARARVGLGRTLLRASEPTRAEDEFRRAARLCPKDPDALHWLGCAAAHQQAYP